MSPRGDGRAFMAGLPPNSDAACFDTAEESH